MNPATVVLQSAGIAMIAAGMVQIGLKSPEYAILGGLMAIFIASIFSIGDRNG